MGDSSPGEGGKRVQRIGPGLGDDTYREEQLGRGEVRVVGSLGGESVRG